MTVRSRQGKVKGSERERERERERVNVITLIVVEWATRVKVNSSQDLNFVSPALTESIWVPLKGAK